jgi:hypothetical protein
MKNILYLLIVASLFLCAYAVFDQVRPDMPSDENIPLSKFIIGKCENKEFARSTVPGTVTEIRFVDETKLVYHVIITDDAYDEEATYEFVSENRIREQGRRDAPARQWQLRRIVEKLEVCYEGDGCITYSRKRIEIWWIFITLATAVSAFHLRKKFVRRHVPDVIVIR